MKTLKYILITFLVLVASLQIYAQSDCDNELANAQELYEDGDFKNAIKKLEKLLDDCDLNKTQENEALKLLASANYEMDELETGNEYVEQFLRKNPFYVASKKNDPYTFRETLGKFKSWPRLSVGARAGLPLTTVFTEKIYPVLDTADYSQEYIVTPLVFGTIEIAYNFNKWLSFYFGFGLRNQKITHKVPMYNSEIEFNYKESSILGNTPVYLQFKLPLKGSFSSAVYFGGEIEALHSVSYSHNYILKGSLDDYTIFLSKARERTNIDINIEQRIPIRRALIGGVKFIYKINKITVFADARYIKELDLYNNPDSHFVDPNLYITNSYTLSDIRLETIDFSIGFTYNLWYKVKSKY